ncbi:sensor histidine kinase [Foetidibacter luteolus]|uniref:sensor histidine kinase n=1 Tax=Foetidibacter luteolus TaxID=2608880 RepID=UPI00129C0339|nr:histidine kinase [Foetidibacter luteolus]
MNVTGDIKPSLTLDRKRQFLNDGIVKLIGIPLFGILIPNITRLITNSAYQLHELLLSYGYFVIVSFIVWQGNVLLMKYLSYRVKWKKETYYNKILALLASNVMYSGLVSAGLIYVWLSFSHEQLTNWNPLINSTFVIIIAAAFVTNIYENFFLIRQQLHTLSRVEQLSLAKSQAELHALKNQIDPHFIFNALNTLSYLIVADAKNAKLYNDTLARVYQYILSNKHRDVVLLREELEFISNYFYLLKIRFANAINMTIEINDMGAGENLILPISLQTLIENAIKHNDFCDEDPLEIQVSVETNYVVVKNRMHKKAYPVPSSRIGLANLDNRYRLIARRNILKDEFNNYFVVKLPIISIKQ